MNLLIEQVRWNSAVATGSYIDLIDENFRAGAPEAGLSSLIASGPRLLIARGEHPGRTTGTCIIFGTRPKNVPPGIPGAVWYGQNGRLNGMLSIHVDEFAVIWELVTNSTLMAPRSVRIDFKDGSDHNKGMGILVSGVAVVG